MAHRDPDNQHARASVDRTSGGKVGAAMFALTCTMLVALAGIFVMAQSMFPWMTVVNQPDPSTAPTADTSPVNVTTSGPTRAQRTVAKVMSIPARGLAQAGWEETTSPTGMPGLSFGFGCDPTDGLAPVVARGRAWSAGGRVLEVSARAYSAGGGAAAFDGATAAVLDCSAASLYDGLGLGVASVQVVARNTSAVLWRRGDVLMVATISGGTSVTSTLEGLREFDAALAEQMDRVCPQPEATSVDATRSPYLSRKNYKGHFEQVNVRRDKQPKRFTAQRLTDAKVVPVPARTVPVPTIWSLPVPPVPAITDGPTALPAPVAAPTAPTAPTGEPENRTAVAKQVDDPTGPGCGWAFTGQVQPPFDAEGATTAFEADVEETKHALAVSWRTWQQAKASYFEAYQSYQRQARRYRSYAAQVEQARAAWLVVEQARTEYQTALAAYEAAVAAFDQWVLDAKAARDEFRADKQECKRLAEQDPDATSTQAPQPLTPRKAAPTSTPTATPTATPTSSPTASPTSSPTKSPTATPTATPTKTPTATPTATPTPTIVCPPIRPAILSSVPPVIPPSPVPAPEAQLPTPSSAPASGMPSSTTGTQNR